MNESQFPNQTEENLQNNNTSTPEEDNLATESEETKETDPQSEEAQATKENEEESGEEEIIQENSTEKAVSFVYDLTELFVISFSIVMILLCLFVRHSNVNGSSMEPTIQNGDTLLVSNIAYTPKQGDIVIVHSLHNLDTPLVKRVIAVGGDTVSINFARWMIEVNGVVYEQRLDENGNDAQIGGEYVRYIKGSTMGENSKLIQIGFHYDPETDTYTATVPEGHLFILGDNRLNSKDSRDPSVGFVDERLVMGKAPLRLSPFSNFGILD